MQFVNLTSKTIILKVKGEGGKTVRPSGFIPTVKTKKERITPIDGLEAYQMLPTEVVGLPEKADGIIYLVSDPSIILLTKRDDIISIDRQIYGADDKSVVALMELDV